VSYKCVQCLVSGRVQGVWFRGSTRERALVLGVTGYARNLPDGRVKVLACGESAAVDALVDWLSQGPSHAVVTQVTTRPVDSDAVPEGTGFVVR
jgi:acylphosphatase